MPQVLMGITRTWVSRTIDIWITGVLIMVICGHMLSWCTRTAVLFMFYISASTTISRFWLLQFYTADDVVLYKHGERSADALKSTGFANVVFKSYNRFDALLYSPSVLRFPYAIADWSPLLLKTRTLYCSRGAGRGWQMAYRELGNWNFIILIGWRNATRKARCSVI
jgi:hypothetical protein